jgi:thiol:disulfide interchange protein DsbD
MHHIKTGRLTALLALWLLLPPAGAANRSDLDAVLDQSRSAHGGDEFLPPEQAFRFSAAATTDAAGARQLRLDWIIAPGYYLYRDRIHIASAQTPERIGTPQLPPGQIKSDEYFGKQVIYHQELVALVPVQGGSRAPLALSVTYQGCAEAGLCYPPITRAMSIDLAGGPVGGAGAGNGGGAMGSAAAGTAGAGSGAGTVGSVAAAALAGTTANGSYVSEQDRLALLLRSGNLLQVLLEFFLGGLLLAFTPCVLPMVPILSGLIVGHGARVTTTRAFLLSLTYVLGMAVTYTATGVACAAAGKQVQAVFQQPWIILLFAALFIAMAFAMFGLFTVQMPSFVQSRLAQISNRQRSGSVLGVGVMGMLSALIVTTCVGPVLVAALIVIGQTGDMFRGGAALFAMSLGMGAPLLVVGSSAGRWLPRAGAWMEGVKRLFGVVMLAMAAWMLARIVPDRGSLLLFAVPAFAAAVVCWGFLGARTPAGVWLARSGAVLAALYGVALLVGAARGADDPLQPFEPAALSAAALDFHPVANVADLRAQVRAAAAAHQAVLLDIDADWCTSCKEMQRYTFTDPQVRRALQSMLLLRANVTANSAEDQALLHEFQIFGPPTIAVYDASGHEQQAYRVVGYMKAAPFAALLHQALSSG